MQIHTWKSEPAEENLYSAFPCLLAASTLQSMLRTPSARQDPPDKMPQMPSRFWKIVFLLSSFPPAANPFVKQGETGIWPVSPLLTTFTRPFYPL